MKKVIALFPTLMLLAACSSSPNPVAPAGASLNVAPSVGMTSAPAAEGLDQTDDMAQNGWDGAVTGSQIEMGAWQGAVEAPSAPEGDAWANSCGPNAGYEEQLVCSGVPGGSVPRG